MDKGQSKTRGATLIEAMISMAILVGFAGALYPTLFNSKKIGMIADFHSMCINAAQTKLSEYTHGSRNIFVHASDIASGNYKINPGLDIRDVSLSPRVLDLSSDTTTAFSFAKERMNIDDSYCPRKQPTLPEPQWVTEWLPKSNKLSDFGNRECAVGFLASGGCTSPYDLALAEFAPDLKLYVMLRRINVLSSQQRPVGALGGANSAQDQIDTEDCPARRMGNSGNREPYDFMRAGDAIKITVTGVNDTQAGQTFAGYASRDTDPNSNDFACQVSTIIRQIDFSARYFMSDMGEIYRWTGQIARLADTGQTGPNRYGAFPSVWSPSNLGFVVSPFNDWLFVLRRGTITRYQIVPDPSLPGLYDVNLSAATQVSWNVDPGIISITGKFLNQWPASTTAPTCGIAETPGGLSDLPILYGLMGDGQSVVCMNLSDTAKNVAGAQQLVAIETNGVNPFAPPKTGTARFIFMEPHGVGTYYGRWSQSDSTANPLSGGLVQTSFSEGYNTTIYSGLDFNFTQPQATLFLRAIAFSK